MVNREFEHKQSLTFFLPNLRSTRLETNRAEEELTIAELFGRAV
jgi:hypothetical protein